MPVINALTDEEHPTQAIADVATIKQEFGTLEGVHVLFIGEGNNIARSLVLALTCYSGVTVSLVSPDGFGLPEDTMALARSRAAMHGSKIENVGKLRDLPCSAEVVYTTRWRSMGQDKQPSNWRSLFEPYRVNVELIERVGSARSIFLHDLPAERGAEVTDAVIDGPSSRVFAQARNKVASAIASLEFCTRSPRN